ISAHARGAEEVPAHEPLVDHGVDGTLVVSGASPTDAVLGRIVGRSRFNRRSKAMIFGAHVILYSQDAAADRAFFRDVLGYPSVDAGHGWLIFALPPAEVAVHPAEADTRDELYLMSDDLSADMAALAAKNVLCSKVEEARWGYLTRIQLPGGGTLGLY